MKMKNTFENFLANLKRKTAYKNSPNFIIRLFMK